MCAQRWWLATHKDVCYFFGDSFNHHEECFALQIYCLYLNYTSLFNNLL